MRRFDDPAQAARWLKSRVQGTLQADSRQLAAGDGFIAFPGQTVDARRFVDGAIERGASACLVEDEGVDAHAFDDEMVASYPGLKAAAGLVASAFFGEPSSAMDLVAVTGTNGKTSTAWWIAQALTSLSKPCGVVGTLGTGVPDRLSHTGLTTPDPVLLQRELRHMLDAGLTACAMEASSVGIVEGRLAGTQVRVAVFTNFTQDHLDYHGDMEAYWAAKRQLFSWPGLRSAVINLDDEKGALLERQLEGQGLELWTYAIDRPARLMASAPGYHGDGLSFDLVEGQQRQRVVTGVIGRYNISNLLAVVASLRALGVSLADAARACSRLGPVPGRMERIAQPGKPLVVVDYAHTPDALDKALQALRPLAGQRSGQLWCVFGCGGDRDPTKRPLMAAVAGKNADRVVVTSDNPRSEKPESIVSQILLGLARQHCVHVEVDRARAIAFAVGAAVPADVVLVAGKGHEEYQEIGGQRQPFSDRAQALAALAGRETVGEAA